MSDTRTHWNDTPPPSDDDAPEGVRPKREKVPPHDLGAELALIGAALMSSVAANEAAAMVTADDFYRLAHKDAWIAIAQVVGDVGAADPVLVADVAVRNGMDRDEVTALLMAATAETPAVSRSGHYCRIVADHANRRRQILAAVDLQEGLILREDERVNRARSRLEELARQQATPSRLTVRGDVFVLDQATDFEARWGDGGSVLWARGESLMICAPPGAGKTTVAVQILGGLLGLWPSVLGLPVLQARRVLYLAMDRPRQIRRAMRRILGEGHREVLAERLVVRGGPLPEDLGRRPELLLQLAQAEGCDVVIVDSLKDAAVKLTDDEVGGNVNRAVQFCNAHDIDVLVLHHQRKGDGSSGKPTTIADVYGSTWLTAGAGSVILLWGEPGAELVELTHLKQPAEPVGPWQLEHDHHAGTTKVARGFDALAYLRQRGTAGATVNDAAQAEHGSPQKPGEKNWKRTERRLRSLVKEGLAAAIAGDRHGSGTFEATRYVATSTVDTIHGQGF